MTPVNFPGCNVTFGGGQSEYQPLPAMKMPDGEVYTCWELSVNDVAEIVRTGKIYLRQLTFNEPLQPLYPMAALGDDMNIG